MTQILKWVKAEQPSLGTVPCMATNFSVICKSGFNRPCSKPGHGSAVWNLLSSLDETYGISPVKASLLYNHEIASPYPYDYRIRGSTRREEKGRGSHWEYLSQYIGSVRKNLPKASTRKEPHLRKVLAGRSIFNITPAIRLEQDRSQSRLLWKYHGDWSNRGATPSAETVFCL